MGIADCVNLEQEGQCEIKGFDRTVLVVEANGIENTITVLNENDNYITVSVEQGNINNLLTISSDGRIILDGNAVVIKYDTDSNVAPRSAGSSYNSASSPQYGTTAEYSHYYTTSNVADIELNETLSSIALTVLLSIMGYAMYEVLGALIPTCLDIGVDLYNYFTSVDSDTTYLSCKSTIYTHSRFTSGYIPSLFMYIYKYRTTFYSRRNYNGSSITKVSYLEKYVG